MRGYQTSTQHLHNHRFSIHHEDLEKISAIRVITSSLIFQHNYQLTPQEGRRIDTLIDALVKEGKLTTGKWRKRVRVGFYLVQRMAIAWFTQHLTHGCRSWDLVISKFLSISLMTSLHARAGDVIRTGRYTGMECLCWKDIELRLEGNEPKVEGFVAQVTLRFEKGFK